VISSSCVYLVSFLRYQMWNNGVPLKSGLTVIQGHWKQHRSIDHIRLLICHCRDSSILYHFRDSWLWRITYLTSITPLLHFQRTKFISYSFARCQHNFRVLLESQHNWLYGGRPWGVMVSRLTFLESSVLAQF